ncbi:hypothetical protein EG68_03198 [Paragonimus skrjabini miyazakii]|uniref:MIR domain-containing protein n=1 Tax=Paragonimus skrjabini miyazakii TaxID=59628 RepID=A0A8S9Z3G2_9TREM|nr:hypothetical protein EG68_03198 [Paragonimus skrjabini miyazakii]
MSFAVFFSLALRISLIQCASHTKEVTCGSVLKLHNAEYDARLHSHEVQYGSGSGQQSVTAVTDAIDSNSYWQIFERNGSPRCNRGRIIKCGQTIRLMHLNTRKNLHSHHFQSPLSHNFEVSAFGNDGVGDEGDDWQVICDGPYWLRKSRIQLKHISTEGYLHLPGQRYNRPIAGHFEASSSSHQAVESHKTVLMESTMSCDLYLCSNFPIH